MNRLAVRLGGLRAALGAAAFVGISAPAFADTVYVTYSAAGQTAPDFTSICSNTTTCVYGTEDFSAWTGGSFISSFNDAGNGTYNQPGATLTQPAVTFTGSYAAGPGTGTSGSQNAWVPEAQNQYGGVNGKSYPELFGAGAGVTPAASYTLSLSASGVPGINYFGVWISALDAYNDLKIYDGTTVIAEFDSAKLLADLGTCTSGPNPYCGNPTTQFPGQDSGELFAYINVFDVGGYITSVQFSDTGNTGFESTNDAVAYVNPIHPTGTVVDPQSGTVDPVPEPASVAVLAVGLTGLAAAVRRRSRHQPAAA